MSRWTTGGDAVLRSMPPWARVAGLLFAVSFGTNTSTPLLVLYRHRLGLSPTAVTSIFAVYAVGLLIAVLFAGPASDRLGRRRVVVPMAALAVVTSLLFLPAAHVAPLLYVARFCQGLVSGAVFSVGSAWLQESSAEGLASVAARRAAVAMNAGFALGPLTAGLLGQWAPAPTVLPYLVHVALTVVGLLLVRPVLETVVSRRGGPLLSLRFAPGARRPFWLVLVPTSVLVFAFPAVAGTALPLLLAPGTPQIALAGLVAGLSLGAAALVAPAARPLGRAAAPLGLVAGAAGLLVAMVAARDDLWQLLLGVAVVLGVASGLTMTAGLTKAELLATAQTRGAVYAGFYACIYVGFGVPVVMTATYGDRLAVPLAVLAGLAVALAAWLARPGVGSGTPTREVDHGARARAGRAVR